MQIGSHFKPFHGSLGHLEEKIQPPTMTQKALCHPAPVDLSRLGSGPFLTHFRAWAGQLPPSPLQLFLKLTPSLTSFGSLLAHHFHTEASLDHFIQSWPPSFSISTLGMLPSYLP